MTMIVLKSSSSSLIYKWGMITRLSNIPSASTSDLCMGSRNIVTTLRNNWIPGTIRNKIPPSQFIEKVRPFSTPPYKIIRAKGKVNSFLDDSGRYKIEQTSSFSSSSLLQDEVEKDDNGLTKKEGMRLSKWISTYDGMSRRSAETLIQSGLVTVAGKTANKGSYILTWEEVTSGGGIIKVNGKRLIFPETRHDADCLGDDTSSNSEQKNRTRVWLAHKLAGELVTEHDPNGRPSLVERLMRGGVGKEKKGKNNNSSRTVHLKPIGRLDMMTEGLVIVTNDGKYARDMELPKKHAFHRTYRVRVHGLITPKKLEAIRSGMNIRLDKNSNSTTRIKGMKVQIEMRNNSNSRRSKKGGNTNSWLRITCTQGKNRQIRRVLEHLGLTVSRLIRISYGDYDLNTIPPGMAIEVPVKQLKDQKRKGQLFNVSVKKRNQNQKDTNANKSNDHDDITPVQWVRHV